MEQEIPCRHFGRCSGCVQQHHIDQLTCFEQMRLFFAKHALQLPPPVTGEATGWRHRAKLVVAPSRHEGMAIGLYRAHSHDVEPIPGCLVHHPRLQYALSILHQVLEQEAIAPYKESRRSGLLRYLLLSLEEESQSVQVTFVVAKRSPSVWQACVSRLLREAPSLWHSLWLNHNARADNVIWGEDWDLLWGKPWLHTQIGLAAMALHPGCFFQANVPLFRILVDDLTSWMKGCMSLVELYSGCGVMGLHLAAMLGCHVVCCERNPIAELSFHASCARMQGDVGVEFVVESAEKALYLLDDAESVLVDPPRKGLTAELMAALLAGKQGMRLFYMSCGWKTLMRDCEILCASGWSVKRAKSYLFFPGTDQLELLVEMVKES